MKVAAPPKEVLPLGHKRCNRCHQVRSLELFPVMRHRGVEVRGGRCNTCFKVCRMLKNQRQRGKG